MERGYGQHPPHLLHTIFDQLPLLLITIIKTPHRTDPPLYIVGQYQALCYSLIWPPQYAGESFSLLHFCSAQTSISDKTLLPELYPHAKLSELYPHVKLSELYPHMKLSELYPHVKLSELYPHMELSELYPHMKLSELYPHMKLSELYPHVKLLW